MVRTKERFDTQSDTSMDIISPKHTRWFGVYHSISPHEISHRLTHEYTAFGIHVSSGMSKPVSQTCVCHGLSSYEYVSFDHVRFVL